MDRPLDKAITQRTVLSFVSSVFDPVGLVAPYTVRARLLLKDIWKISGQSWDDELPEDIRDKFLEWHSGLPLLGQLTIPRCYFFTHALRSGSQKHGKKMGISFYLPHHQGCTS